MGPTDKQNNGLYSYADYHNWPEDERWELINGTAFNMTPAPSRRHQKALGELYRQFSNYLSDKTCEVYPAPFDVRLPPEANEDKDHVRTVLQPDISVICDPSKLDDAGCLGAPDLVIEIVSPYTVQRDVVEKFAIYERFGVREYWIVHPVDMTVMVFTLQPDNKFGRPEMYMAQGKINVGVLPGLTIDLSTVFKN